MAGPCVLYNGKKYTKGEFAALLHDGELSNLIGNSKLDATVLKGEIPAQFKVATPEPKKMSVITPEKSSNFANLTQDDEGNAVFFHVGDTGYETIKPSSGQSTRTSKGEAAAIGKVGGVAMYYTSPNDSETMVTGPGKYAVKVPIEKVYDFNTDENNYLEEAQKRHEAENPGKAMDANSELAYITKIAGENGYDMVVADWGGKTRAQTTKELTPTDTQVSNGAQVTKTFDEKYVPNTEKGFVSVVPESKDSKFQKIYDKIYKYRNSQQNYDALYKLSTSSLDREGITKLVNESDLPQDLKDEYNKVDKQKQGKRRSYMKTEEVSVEGAPEGNYLNVGMEIGKDGEMLTIEEIKEALPDDVEVSEELVKNVESEFNGEPSVEPTTILKISRPLTDAEMQNLLVATDQMGISQMVDGKGVVHGTEQWGKFNPKFFHMPDSRVLSDVVSKEKTIEQEVEEISNLFSTDINKAVENAKAALANLLPDVKFVIHDSYDSYTKAVGDEDVESGGTYVSKTNTIHINKRAATKTTVAHEVFHAVLLNMVGTDVKAADVTKRMINALSKQLDNNPDLKEYLENFVASYDENIKNEEKAAELFGYLAANYDTLPKQSQNLVKRWMDAIAKLFGFKPFTDNEVADFFNTLSEKVATGQEVVKSDVKVLGDNKKSETKKERERKQTSVISNKIKTAKQAGFSDAAISQYLQNNGYTPEQASKGLLDYNKKEIQKAQKEEGIFLEDTGGKFKNYIGKIRRTIISARGFMAKSQRLGIEERVANIEYQLKMASNTSKKIDRLLRNYKGDKEKVLSDFDLYIRGDNSVIIPNEFKALADIGRNQIDGLTYMLIKFQAIPADSVEKIKANIGSYMNRAYEIYNNKNWPKKVKQEVVENAKSYFRTELLKIALNNSKSTGNNINDEVLNSLNEIQNKTNELERLISDYKKSKNNQTKVIDKVKEVSALMTKYGFEEGNQLFDYISKTGNNFDDRKISDKIDSFFKRTSIIKKSATSSKTSGIDLNTQLERDIDNQIDKILNKDITNDFINSGKEGAKDLSVLKKRMDIPLEIRALMGEYTDPVQNYVNTVRKLSEFAYRAKYLTEIKEKGLGTIFFEKEDVNRPQNFKYEIASDSTKTLDPLGGLYTSKELKEVFDNNASLLEQTGNTLNKFSFIRNYMRTLRYVKKAATIQSVGTQSKNALGAFEFALSNGHFDLKEYSDAYKVVRNDLKNGGNKFLEDKMLDYIKSGAITQNVALGEIKSMFKDDDFEKAFERRMNTPDQSKLSKIIKASKSYLNKADKILIDAYQSSDNLFKIIGFEIERKRYSDILYDKKYEALTDDQKKDVDRVVAENIKNIYPNYDRIGEIGKFFKVFPAGASFISFELESLRTSYNTVSLAFSEMKSDNPKSRKLGATRFAALAATRLLRESLRYATGAATFGWLRGLGDDEEEEANKKAKRFTPEYTKNSSISIIDMGKGKFSYIDFSASDPRSKMPKMLEAFISGEDPSSMLINLIEESVSPFVSDDILLNTITNLYNNEDDFGKPIFNKYDTPLNIGNNIITYASKVFLPGTVKSVQKVVKSDSQVAASIGQVTGYRIADVEIEKQYYFKAKKTSEELRKANDIYDDAFRKFEKGEITDKERKEAYDQSNKSVKLVLGEANKDFNSAVFFGANPDALNETLSKVRLSESDQIMTGEFEDIDSKIPLTKEESMKEIERLKEKARSRGIKNLDEIRRKVREKGGN